MVSDSKKVVEFDGFSVDTHIAYCQFNIFLKQVKVISQQVKFFFSFTLTVVVFVLWGFLLIKHGNK